MQDLCRRWQRPSTTMMSQGHHELIDSLLHRLDLVRNLHLIYRVGIPAPSEDLIGSRHVLVSLGDQNAEQARGLGQVLAWLKMPVAA